MILTDDHGKKFYINVDHVEQIELRPYLPGSLIYLASGREVECVEEFMQVVEKFEISKALSK